MAFGDAMNDREMLAQAGQGFIMGNAMAQDTACVSQCPNTGRCGSAAFSCAIALPIMKPCPACASISRSFIASPNAIHVYGVW